MMRLRDLRFGVKQWLGLGAILFVMAGLSVFSIVQMGRLRQEIDEINALAIPSMIALSSINLDVSTLRSFQLQFALTGREGDRERLSARMAVLIDSITVNREEYDRIASVTPRLEPFDTARDSLYDRFDEQWDDYQASFMELLFGAPGAREEAVELLAGADDVYLALNRTLEDLIDINKQRSAEAARVVQVNATRSRRVIVFVLVATVVLSSFFSALLVRFMTRPLRRLEEAAQDVARGKLDVQLAIDSHDEIGSLARSFNQMTSSLSVAQQQLIVKEKLASLGQLTAGIAHEIKNPLNFVNNFADLSVELTNDLGDVVARHTADWSAGERGQVEELMSDLQMNARKIAEHGRRADSIVRSMLLHSRGSQGERQPTDINAFVEDNTTLAYHGIRAEKPELFVEIERDLDPTVGAVEVVPQDFGRVLINLLNNAFYAVHERARTTAQADTPRVKVATRSAPNGVSIAISDNGNGIPETLKKRVFEPFFTTKPTGEGTGLGLSLSYDIVTRGHGGTLTMQSQVGEGTTFTVWLPFRGSPPANPPEA
jgi:signal transduction histidine kinase